MERIENTRQRIRIRPGIFRLSLIGLFGLLALAGGRHANAQPAAEPKISVQLESQEIYQGQSVLYRVTVASDKSISPPEVDGGDDFQVESLGSRQNASQVRIQINNGHRTESRSEPSWSFDYRLTPQKSGLLILPGPKVEVAGKVYTGSPASIQVLPPDKQDAVKLWISTSSDAVYPMEPFDVTLNVAMKTLAPPHSNRNPVEVIASSTNSVAVISIPWAQDNRLPKGLAPTESSNSWLSGLIARRGAGFNVNGLRSQSFAGLSGSGFGGGLFSTPFDSMFSETPYLFLPRSRRVDLNDADGNPATYWQYEFTRSFVPTKTGRFEFGPATYDGPAIVDLSLKNVFVTAQPVSVTVKSPPEEGRPASYTGAIGRFQITSELSPTEAAIGDPMTLKLTVSGRGTMDYIGPPELSHLPDVSQHFKVYDATEQRDNGQCLFTYGLRPLDNTIQQFPAVPFTYFDTDTDRYVTLSTEPIDLAIHEADQLKASQIVGAAPVPQNGASIEARSGGIFANITDPSTVSDQRVHFWTLAAYLGGLAIVYIITVIGIRRREHLSANQDKVRRRGAIAESKSRMNLARSAMNEGMKQKGIDLLRCVFTGLIADVEDLPEAGLTPRDVQRYLQQREVEPATVQQVVDLLEQCDAVRYGATTDMAGLGRKAESILDELLRQMKRKNCFR